MTTDDQSPDERRIIALVTGGSSGIGAMCARALFARGMEVLACGRRYTGNTGLGKTSVGHAHLDVTDEAEVIARFAELPHLDVLVCSAGIGTFAPVVDATAAELREMLEVHVTGTFLCAREALKRMIPRRSGHIVAIGSHVVHRAFPSCGAYTAAKAAQAGLMRVIAEEARPHDIRVTTLLVGATDTPIWDARPEFDRAKMMRTADVASFLVELVTRRALAIEEVTVMPPAGAL